MSNSLNVSQFSRREFLRLSSAALLALLALDSPSLAYAADAPAEDEPIKLGRLTKNKIDLLDRPSPDANVLRTLKRDDVLQITNSTIGSGEQRANTVWYELNGEGFVHSGTVQPVTNRLNDLVKIIPSAGLLAEVTVPYTDAVWDLQNKEIVPNRLYYSTTHWILGTAQDDQGKWWYEVLEDFYQKSYFVESAHLRVIPFDETTTLSPSVPTKDKKIKVNLGNQLVTAYEGDSQVQLFRCSAGITTDDVSLTPTGDFRTDYKRPSRHMIDGNDHHMNTYNLPGVPWISYLDENGISFHGTYWHNNFGEPMSHGCINLPPEAAKWIYRWTLPAVAHDAQRGYKLYGGTKVEIS